MKTAIALSILNTNGATAQIENEDGRCAVFEAYTNGDAANACKQAAKKLRALAARFDKLALAKDPFMSATQAKINREAK